MQNLKLASYPKIIRISKIKFKKSNEINICYNSRRKRSKKEGKRSSKKKQK